MSGCPVVLVTVGYLAYFELVKYLDNCLNQSKSHGGTWIKNMILDGFPGTLLTMKVVAMATKWDSDLITMNTNAKWKPLHISRVTGNGDENSRDIDGISESLLHHIWTSVDSTKCLMILGDFTEPANLAVFYKSITKIMSNFKDIETCVIQYGGPNLVSNDQIQNVFQKCKSSPILAPLKSIPSDINSLKNPDSLEFVDSQSLGELVEFCQNSQLPYSFGTENVIIYYYEIGVSERSKMKQLDDIISTYDGILNIVSDKAEALYLLLSKWKLINDEMERKLIVKQTIPTLALTYLNIPISIMRNHERLWFCNIYQYDFGKENCIFGIPDRISITFNCQINK